MSTDYRKSCDVPTGVLCDRLRQLADFISQGPGAVRHAFSMRVPAEPDRDADIVISEAANRLSQHLGSRMGVGSGDGNLFVYGDHDSIKAAQAIVLDRERIQVRIGEMAAEIDRLTVERDKLNGAVDVLTTKVEELRGAVHTKELIIESKEQGGDELQEAVDRLVTKNDELLAELQKRTDQLFEMRADRNGLFDKLQKAVTPAPDRIDTVITLAGAAALREALKHFGQDVSTEAHAEKALETHAEAIFEVMLAGAPVPTTEKDSAVAVPDEIPVHALDAVSEALGDCYYCTRTWQAWSYGTMTRDDFHQVAESSERVDEIARAAITAFLSMQSDPSPSKYPPVQSPCAYQSKFDSADTWTACSKEHHDMVKESPDDWKGYGVRAVFDRPVSWVKNPECDALTATREEIKKLNVQAGDIVCIKTTPEAYKRWRIGKDDLVEFKKTLPEGVQIMVYPEGADITKMEEAVIRKQGWVKSGDDVVDIPECVRAVLIAWKDNEEAAREYRGAQNNQNSDGDGTWSGDVDVERTRSEEAEAALQNALIEMISELSSGDAS